MALFIASAVKPGEVNKFIMTWLALSSYDQAHPKEKGSIRDLSFDISSKWDIRK